MFHKYLKHKKVFLIIEFQSVQKSINQLFKRTWDFLNYTIQAEMASRIKNPFIYCNSFFLSFSAVSKVLFWIIHRHFLLIFHKHLFFQIRRTFKWAICKVTCFIIFALKMYLRFCIKFSSIEIFSFLLLYSAYKILYLRILSSVISV